MMERFRVRLRKGWTVVEGVRLDELFVLTKPVSKAGVVSCNRPCVIMHEASGYAFPISPFGFVTKREAIEIVKRLRRLKIDWHRSARTFLRQVKAMRPEQGDFVFAPLASGKVARL